MPRFSTALPQQTANRGFDLLRTPITQPLRGVITSDTLIVCDTHYWHGRTTPCERIVNENGKTIDDTPCQACRMKQPWRTHCYVSAFDAKTHVHFIFECTDAAAEPLEHYFKANGTVRGCVFNAYRAKQTANGKVTIVTSAADQTRIILPRPPDLVKALCVLWRIPLTAANLSNAPAGRENLNLNPDVMDIMHGGDENGQDADKLDNRRQELLTAFATQTEDNGKPKRKKAKA